MNNLIAKRYLIQEELGSGGMGTVYKATDTSTEQPVAVKLLNPKLTSTELIERFKREGEALRDLNHPNIVKNAGRNRRRRESLFGSGVCQRWRFERAARARGKTGSETLCKYGD